MASLLRPDVRVVCRGDEMLFSGKRQLNRVLEEGLRQDNRIDEYKETSLRNSINIIHSNDSAIFLFNRAQLRPEKKKELNYIHFNKEKENKCFSTNNRNVNITP